MSAETLYDGIFEPGKQLIRYIVDYQAYRKVVSESEDGTPIYIFEEALGTDESVVADEHLSGEKIAEVLKYTLEECEDFKADAIKIIKMVSDFNEFLTKEAEERED